MRKIFKFIVGAPKIALAITLALCVWLAFYAPKLEIDASTQTLLLENDKDLAIWREVSKRYETPNFLVVTYTPKGDLLAPETLKFIRDISSEFATVPNVKDVTSILTVPLLENKKLPLKELIEHVPTLADEGINLEKAKREFLTSPLYKKALVSEDFSTTAIVINLQEESKYGEFIERRDALNAKEREGNITAAERKELAQIKFDFKAYRDDLRAREHENLEKIKAVIAAHPDEKLFIGGINMIADDMISFVRSDLATYGASVFVLVALCLWLFFRQIRYVALSALICALSVVAASGLFGALGYEITVISSNYVALQLIITVSVVIHLIVGYREIYTLHPLWSQARLTYLTLRTRWRPCFFAVATTVIGFASLSFSAIRPVIALGNMMSGAISVSLVLAFAIFGSLNALLPKLAPKRNFENNFRFTELCARVAVERRGLIYGVSALVVIAGLVGVSLLKVENSFIGYFKQSTEIYKGMAVIDRELGGTIPLDVTIRFSNLNNSNLTSRTSEARPCDDGCERPLDPSEVTRSANASVNSSDLSQSKSNLNSNDDLDEFEKEFEEDAGGAQYWFSERKINVIRRVTEFLEAREFVGNVGSLGKLLAVGKILNEGRELDSLALALLYNGLPEIYRKILLTPYVSIENDEAHFTLRVVDSDNRLRRDEFINSLRADLEAFLADEIRGGASVQVSGVMVLYNNLLQSLFSSQTSTLGLVLLALGATFILIWRGIRFSLIALVANLVPLCAVFGIMGIFGINLDIMSITIASIALGIGVDDIIHYIHRFRLERARRSPEGAVMASHLSIGYAMYYTSFAIFLGFVVMVSSNFWPTIYFGFLTALVMAAMLLSALLLLPALILTFKRD